MSKKTKIRVALIFGGKSAEHAISLRSAAAIHRNLDRAKFEPLLIYINRQGEWCLTADESFQEEAFGREDFHSFLPWDSSPQLPNSVDIYFPVLHGPNGEDGKIQGLFEMAGKPYVGANSFSSALAMDKVVSKLLFQREGLQVADSLFFEEKSLPGIAGQVRQRLGFPVFVKPCSLGSSVGVSRVLQESELADALALAFSYDSKILVEKAIAMRELEVSVMGNREVRVSRPGELIPFRDFYDYEDKYLLNKTRFHIPVELGQEKEAEVRAAAEKAYRSLFLNGYARVDLFLEKGSDRVLVNEINTIPGFTEISMFPKLWQAEGLSFRDLLTCLIDYGFEYQHSLKVNVHEHSGS